MWAGTGAKEFVVKPVLFLRVVPTLAVVGGGLRIMGVN